jgi:hypothetical protein
MRSPILFLVFNRPDVTKVVFEQIRRSKPSKLYIAADGPRASKDGELEQCEKVRRIVSGVDWECEVKTKFSHKNLGCKKAVSSAIDWFFSNEEEGIILEDDCLPHSDFFKFCDELLDRYRQDQRVGAICGTNLYNLNCVSENDSDTDSYYFSKGASVWGWATWKRVWDDYDPKISSWDILRDSPAFRSTFRHRKWKLLVKTFNSVFDNRIDTWDYQFGFMLLKSNRLCATSNINLIENIGFNESATHTKSKLSIEGNNKSYSLTWPLRHPIGFFPSSYKDNYLDLVYSSKIVKLLILIIKKFRK